MEKGKEEVEGVGKKREVLKMWNIGGEIGGGGRIVM
jgi:hypothetical protein